MNVYHDPGQDRFVTELYAWVAVDPKTTLEGICAVGNGTMMPMQAVASEKRLMMLIKPHLQELSRLTGKKLKLIRFTKAEILEEI